MDPDALAEAFRERPAIHRYPAAMARRVQDLCRFLAERYDGQGERVWTEAGDAADMRRRIHELPGFGDMKATALTAVLVKRLGVRPAGWETVLPGFPTLGDVDSPEALADYQAKKRAHKAALRAGRAER